MTGDKLRWGFLSTAQIARKNWKAIRNSGNATIVAVASRDAARSKAFIASCQADAPMEEQPRALGSYEELLAAKDVDAVYIPLPTGLRKEWVIRAAEAGKHVVCEKPCANNLADLREMTEACRRNKVQFMDGVMFMHSQRLEKIRACLQDPSIMGDLKRITSAFSFCGGDDFFSGNIRANSTFEPFGSLGDLGWYNIRLALWAMKEELPLKVTGRILKEFKSPGSPAAVPTEFSGELLFAKGVSCGFYCSFLTRDEQWACFSGNNGVLRLNDFVLPFVGNEVVFEVNQAGLTVTGCDFHMESHPTRVAVPEFSHSHPSSQETNLFRNFSNQVRSGSLNTAWPEMALKTQQVMQACLESARADGRPISL